MTCNEHRVFILKHDTPEISRGAIVEASCGDTRYVVVNLFDVARYPLTVKSKFTFHRFNVENMPYWFEELN